MIVSMGTLGQSRRISRRRLGRWVAACTLAVAMGAALAAPNPGPRREEGGYQTAAPNAILIEAESGSVLFEKNADELIAPASLSKLMTAEVVLNELKQNRLQPSDTFVVSENAWRRG